MGFRNVADQIVVTVDAPRSTERMFAGQEDELLRQKTPIWGGELYVFEADHAFGFSSVAVLGW